jgi:hypothetical protein
LRLAILYNLREKSGAKLKNRQSYSNPRDQFSKRLCLFQVSTRYATSKLAKLFQAVSESQGRVPNQIPRKFGKFDFRILHLGV